MNKMRQGLREFYKGKNIFITGSTGFAGTSLVETLLRSFPDVKHIYLLMRKRANKSSEERYAEYFNKKVFEKVKQINPNFRSSVTLMNGDFFSGKTLGLSPSEIDVLKNDINIVFHCAALVAFNRSFKLTMESNVVSTNNLLNIFKQTHKLDSFLYVSTIYSNLTNTKLENMEKIYPPISEPAEVLRAMEQLSGKELEAMGKRLMGDSMNIYTFSKNQAENLVDRCKSEFPVGIIRPGAILSTYKEPFEYWMQGTMAYERILQEIDRGFVNEYETDSMLTTCVPVDMLSNAEILAAYDISKKGNKSNVYNYANGSKNLLYYKEHTEWYIKNIPKLKRLKDKLYYNHWLPFYENFNKNDKDVIGRRKFMEFRAISNVFMNLEIIMSNENMLRAFNELTEEEKRLVYCDLDEFDWRTYYGNMTRGRILEHP